jgi:hypothetical protein
VTRDAKVSNDTMEAARSKFMGVWSGSKGQAGMQKSRFDYR